MEKGLGKNNQGLTFPLKAFENKGRFVLGYKPTKEDKRRLLEEKKERILARIEGRERNIGKIHICDIKKSFDNVGWVNTYQISTIEDGNGSESLNFV